MIIEILLLSLAAGAVGMGLGSLITAIFGGKSDKLISIFLAFAGGVMLSIVFCDLIPEAVEHSNIFITLGGVVVGILVIMALNIVVDNLSKSGKLHGSFAEFFHEDEVLKKRNSMLRSGWIMLFAIALHNIPEGLAMGAAGFHDITLGLTIAIIIALHNIPEGMAISAPLIAGGLSKIKVIGLTILVGSTTILGSILGILIGGVSDYALSISFALAGGAMLYVVFSEMLPHCIVNTKDRIPSYFVLIGIVVGAMFSGLFH